MSYDEKKWIYDHDEKNLNRYALGERGSKPLIFFGINPSTATPEVPDNTINKVKELSTHVGCFGWVMLNVYPQRATDPNNLDKELNNDIHKLNMKSIEKMIKMYQLATYVVGWGNNITKRKYLLSCLKDINNIFLQYNIKVKCIDRNKTGNPKHPLYVSIKNVKLKDFDIRNQYNF